MATSGIYLIKLNQIHFKLHNFLINFLKPDT